MTNNRTVWFNNSIDSQTIKKHETSLCCCFFIFIKYFISFNEKMLNKIFAMKFIYS